MSKRTKERIFIAPANLHADTANLVGLFAEALAFKLADAQEKRGYTNEWMRTDWMNICRTRLMEHLEKGDPRDVAAYCAFLWHHNEPTVAPQLPAAVVANDLIDHHLDNVLRASGSALQHYTMAKSREDMRCAMRAAMLAKAPPQTVARELTPLNDHTRFILGRPNFTLISVANILRKRGDDIAEKAEDEQASAIHFLLNMYEQHGDNWAEATTAELRRIDTMPKTEGGA